MLFSFKFNKQQHVDSVKISWLDFQWSLYSLIGRFKLVHFLNFMRGLFT